MGSNTTIENLEKRNKTLEKRWKIILVIGILFIITRPVALYIVSQKVKNATINQHPLLDPLRQFVPAESYITNVQELRDYLSDLGNKYPDSISIYYENINSGSNISINKHLDLFPASLSKLVQAILIVKKIENKQLSWNTKLKALPEDISSDSGTLYKTIGEDPVTVEKLLEELLVNSDNTAQNILRRQIVVDDYISFQYETGLQDLYNEKGLISAKEYTRAFRVLYTSSYLEPENSQKILGYLSRSTFKDFLAQGIPSDVIFAHKYGENTQYNIFADSGIVYVPGKPYMITVIIKGKDSSPETRKWVVGLMKEISERAYKVSK
jgi:beta-lactamase class A